MRRGKIFSLFVMVDVFIIAAILCLYFRPTERVRYTDLLKEMGRESTNACQKGKVMTAPLKDFRNYPCLDFQSCGRSEELSDDCVRTVCREGPSFYDIFSHTCVPYKSANSDICTYDPKTDVVSGYLHEHNEWEPLLVDTMVQILKRYPELIFVDLGCNIGVYTIAAASIQTKTFCLDANHENLRLVSKSVNRGHLENFVTLIWNALSDKREVVNFKVIEGNIGSSRIGNTEKHNMTIMKNLAVNAIVLDDLQGLFKGKQLYMKIDLEAHELSVLKGASEFFKNIEVRYIQMELLEEETFQAVVDLLQSWGYLMYRDPNGKVRLYEKDFVPGIWPGDVYFLKPADLGKQ